MAKNPGGRPQFDGKTVESVLAKLEQAWALDCSDAEAAAYANISASSLSRYLKSHPEVSQRKEQLKLKPVLAARRAVYRAIAGDATSGILADADLALKYLERKRRDEFSLKSEVEHSGAVTEKIVFVRRESRGQE
ncbi:MAG: hypothetical protein WCS77_00005 [Elusimicrobiaceae bacterium]|jgi:hypothetical protein